LYTIENINDIYFKSSNFITNRNKLYRSKPRESLNFPYANSRISGASRLEESIHYERKTGRGFARAHRCAIFRTAEWKNERTQRVRILVSRAVESPRPRVCFIIIIIIIIITVTRVYLYCVEKKWAGVCNVILHKQDQLIFMRTGWVREWASESALYRE